MSGYYQDSANKTMTDQHEAHEAVNGILHLFGLGIFWSIMLGFVLPCIFILGSIALCIYFFNSQQKPTVVVLKQNNQAIDNLMQYDISLLCVFFV